MFHNCLPYKNYYKYKPQTVNNEVLNTPIRGHYDLVLNKLDKYTKAPLDGAEFNITVEKEEGTYQLYDDDANLDVKNTVIPIDKNAYACYNCETP